VVDSDLVNATDELSYPAGCLGRSRGFHDRTLPKILQIQSKLGKKAIIRSGSQVLTYEQAPKRAALYAGKLFESGVQPHDRVVSFMGSRLEQLELWFGAAWAGATLVPVNTAFRGAQLKHAITTAKPALIVTDRDSLEHLRLEPGALAAVSKILVVGAEGDSIEDSIGVVALEPFLLDAAPRLPQPVKTSDTTAILYTSGTTGLAKGVLCPHGQFFWWGVLTGESLQIGEDDVVFTVLPMFHTNALNALWQSMLHGATYAFKQRFSASSFWRDAIDHGATVTYLLGSMAQILLKRPPEDKESQHKIRSALCPATSVETVEAFKDRFGTLLIEGYGSTETNLVFSNVIGGYAPASMGRPVDEFEVRIVDENDCDVAEGESGELIVRNNEPYSMSGGYFENATATVKSWRNLWFHTGDRVFREPATGVYYFLDRMVDVIRRRGENISSWEVENAILSHPDVEEVAVFGVPSDLGSEEDVMTHIVLHPDSDPDPVKIIRFLETRIAYFAIPRYWEFPTAIPITENGKVKKHELRARGVTSATWDLEASDVQLRR